jgi:hypothetical protein
VWIIVLVSNQVLLQDRRVKHCYISICHRGNCAGEGRSTEDGEGRGLDHDLELGQRALCRERES